MKDTLAFDRVFPVSPARLVWALTDTAARETWGQPSDSITLRIDGEARTGANEVQTCLIDGVPRFRVEVRWILVSPRVLIWHERATHNGDPMHEAEVSQSVSEAPEGARLALKIEAVSFSGADGLDGLREGYGGALDALGRFLKQR
ncbi:hypothetical protein [Maritimibacter sp. DP1N21-5]|uniref:hypothetical protein n=1 Tax=Maritimibacter sp. DP1N21-5 TaxID=2836867 RepID=UPI001C47E559|nr:hypothetical protein [Maritimibacter sp. DP1N21-5]MBV7410039.1 hypothetical protein [Maritimibacter sp. DP1N21-5]